MITLTYPYISPSLTLELKRPKFSNTEKFSSNKIVRESRGGDLVVANESTWPVNRILTLTVPILCPDDAEDILTFIETSLGKEIGLLDYENRQWRGFLMSPQNPITYDAINQSEYQFDFQGRIE